MMSLFDAVGFINKAAHRKGRRQEVDSVDGIKINHGHVARSFGLERCFKI